MTINSLGVVTNVQDFYAYCEVLRSYNNSTPNEKYKFTGKERDTETDLDYFGARYYDSEIGRWTSIDPLADKYPAWSPYNYCVNNPLIYVDPNGTFADPIMQGGNDNISEEDEENKDKKEINWNQVGNGTLVATAGAVVTTGGLLSESTIFGAAYGAAIQISLGVPAMGLGISMIADGFAGGNRQIPGGFMEAFDQLVGGDGTIGEVGDILSGGLPKNGIEGMLTGAQVLQSKAINKIFNSDNKFNNPTPNTINHTFTALVDNTKVHQLKIKK